MLYHIGEVDACGTKPGSIGKYANYAVRTILDVENEVIFLAGISILSYMPPICAYIWLGIFGVAQWKSPFEIIPNFIILSAIKFIATSVGIILSAVLWRSFFRCEKNNISFVQALYLCAVLFLIANFAIFVFHNKSFIFKLICRALPRYAYVAVCFVHRLLQRNIKNDSDSPSHAE